MFSIILIILLFILLGWVYSHLRRATKLFYEERQERGAILASLSDAVLHYDTQGQMILMNPKAEEFFGVKLSEISGIKIDPELWDKKPSFRALVEIIYPKFAPYVLPRGGESLSSEKGLEIHTSRPELRLFVVTKELKDPAGKVQGWVKIIRDISHEAFLSRIKSEFVSIAAHQLRTPLAAVKWSLRLLLDGDFGKIEERQFEFLQKSYDINERMIKLVNDLLDAARIEEGRFGYEFKEIDYAGFVSKLLKNYEVTAKISKVNFIFSESKDLIPPLYADPERLSIALSNLIENSLRYTRPGGRVTVKVSREGEYVETNVSDTGVGIPGEEQPRVFSKFFRASNAVKLETEGTGLGLFIARNIARRHGGEITFVSKEGEGSTFTLTLPLKKELVPAREAPSGEKAL